MKFLVPIVIIFSVVLIFYKDINTNTILPSAKAVFADPEIVMTFPDSFRLEPLLADNEFESKRGLSGIKEPTSMLFVFEYKAIISFWMKDMLFPIDIVWLDGNTVIGFEENLQPENPPITYYQPKTSIDAALEVPAGFVKEHNIAVGNQLDIKFLNR